MVFNRRIVPMTLAALALFAALAPAPPDTLTVNQTLAREQLKLIDQSLDALQQLARGGEISISDARFALWGRRKIEALRISGAPRAEIVVALENHLERAKKDEGYVKQAFEKNQATRVDMIEAHYRRLEAEIWLNQEKAR